jgi:WD40 repeat protein
MYENNSNLTYFGRIILPSKSNERILSLTLSPNEETLLAITNHNHLYQFSFSKINNSTKKETYLFTSVLDGAHTGPIRTGVVCIWKSILFSIGHDRCLKMWNLETKFVIK